MTTGGGSPDAMVQVIGLRKDLGGKAVLQGVDLDIRRGETTVIMGPSGCGKSVLLKHVIGLLRPDSGQVLVDGENVPTLSARGLKHLRQRMGVLFQGSALFDSLDVFENVAFMLRQHRHMRHGELADAVREALELVSLGGTEKLKPAELSGGMRKRVALARAIVIRPELVLYDEPTTGLDPITARGINDLIRGLHERLGVTSVVVTHDVESALFVGSHIAMIENGRIVLEGPPEQVRHSDVPIAARFFADSPFG